MAETMTCLKLYIFLDFILLLSSFGCISSASNGFGSLKLIPRHSPISPLYQTNISDFERFLTDVQISINRNIYFQQRLGKILTQETTLSSLDSTVHWFPGKNNFPYFTVDIGIGTPVVQKTFAFDIYASLTWLKCKPCLNCFKQDRPLFDPKKSRSYKKTITLLSPKWKDINRGLKCSIHKCSYRYRGDYFVNGTASEEQFTFHPNTLVPYKTKQLAFLCGTETNINYFPSTINGVIGFNRAPTSFAKQLKKQIKSRFSYCVPPIYSKTANVAYLKFGDEAVMRKTKIQSSIQSANLVKGGSLYMFEVINFSINNVRLKDKNGHMYSRMGELAFDSNTPYTSVSDYIFSHIQVEVENHLAKFGVSRITTLPPDVGPLLSCYSHPVGFKNFPHMTIHSQTSEFHIPPENLFVHVAERNMSCLAMVQGGMILGIYQQQNTRFIFNLDTKTVSFAKESCYE